VGWRAVESAGGYNLPSPVFFMHHEAVEAVRIATWPVARRSGTVCQNGRRSARESVSGLHGPS